MIRRRDTQAMKIVRRTYGVDMGPGTVADLKKALDDMPAQARFLHEDHHGEDLRLEFRVEDHPAVSGEEGRDGP